MGRKKKPDVSKAKKPRKKAPVGARSKKVKTQPVAVEESAENCGVFEWTPQRETAAVLVAEDRLTVAKQAEQLGVSDRTLTYWKTAPEFKARVKEHQAEIVRRIVECGIARKANRILALNERAQRMQQVIVERATSDEMKDVPGGRTGLIVRQVKGVGVGDNFELVELYAVDTGLLRELRAHEEQAAKELGQLVEKLSLTDPTGEQEFSGNVSADERAIIWAAITARLGLGAREEAGAGEGQPAGQALDRLVGGDASSGDGAGPLAGQGVAKLKPPSASQVFAPIRKISD